MAGTVWTAADAVNNPIRWVKTSPDDEPIYVKCPSAYAFEIDDISKADAGRTATGRMVKSQLYVNSNPVRAFSISAEWAYPTDADVAGLLGIFQKAEYLYINYFNPVSAGYYTAQFYVGNRTMPMYNKPMKRWTSFALKLISRN